MRKHYTTENQDNAIVLALKKQLEDVQTDRLLCSMLGDRNGIRACRKLERATKVAIDKFTKEIPSEKEALGIEVEDNSTKTEQPIVLPSQTFSKPSV